MFQLRHAAVLGLVAVTGACSSSGGTSPEGAGRVALNLSTNAATPALMGSEFAMVAPETYTNGRDTLVINQVQLVLREIELEREGSSLDCGAADDDDCDEIELEARLFDLPLGVGAGATRSITVDIPAGRYKEIEFEVHKPSSSEDRAFVAANPAFDGVSVRVTGTWNGQPFTYVNDVEADYEIEFEPALAVTEGGTTDFTINIDVGTWFRSGTGALIDPRTALQNGPNESTVRGNIQRSIKAFEDDDRDGDDD